MHAMLATADFWYQFHGGVRLLFSIHQWWQCVTLSPRHPLTQFEFLPLGMRVSGIDSVRASVVNSRLLDALPYAIHTCVAGVK